ncbi:hypothetical protein BC941DRAFT_441435 [Chlamydoabsidia padenii]|nr:hypothetical protein BC941DRAFT_441435 [Chlamydoabsidia padenii]
MTSKVLVNRFCRHTSFPITRQHTILAMCYFSWNMVVHNTLSYAFIKWNIIMTIGCIK